MPVPATPQEPEQVVRRREWIVFLFLTFVVAPAMAVAIVGSYGLGVWIYQMIAGPPTG
ncbi:MAG TPA: periplasmic nitrate reductase, NapE protein [Ferrovibrio sp.]|uniref:periplasmic nitrate reductase, NapE protein n=1 Tax=Ferrovibrio sp. TaxID=1917215 RepID=UPI002B4B6C16|nr:periplasmic nitrate reductase, NapE protein [Ferrovibrio sp.]HLT78150.1 periplasmic nitrate reductase, NapE protein [Ferrovibrio sp.]